MRIEDGTLTYRHGKTGRAKVLAVQRLEARASSAELPVSVAMRARYDDAPFTLDGDVGPLSGLLGPEAPAPWPVRLTLAAAGAKIEVAGALAHPLQGRGYNVKLDGAVPDLAALQPFYPRARLPSVRDLTFAARVADSGGRIPDVSALTLHAGASDLSGVLPGLSLTKLDIAAERMDQPIHATLEGGFGGAPLVVAASLGAPASLVPGGPLPVPFPVDVTAEAAGSRISAKGGIADPAHWSGVDLTVAAQVPDLAALSPLAGRSLPALKDVALQARLGEREGGFARGVVLHDLKLTLPQADLAGNGSLGFGERPSVQAILSASRIDADGLRAALAAKRPPPGEPERQAAAPAPPPAPPRPALPQAAKPAWVIPDEALPFDTLRRADADIQMKVGALTSGGAVYHDIAGHLLLQDGKLRLDPFAALLPGGRMDLTLTADATQAAPPVSVAMHAPGLAVKPLLAALGLPDDASGVVEVDLDLRGAGRTPHAIAAGMDGHAGLSMVNGRIENRLIAETIGQALREANLPDIGVGGGYSAVRCFAARLDALHGVAQLRAFLLDEPRWSAWRAPDRSTLATRRSRSGSSRWRAWVAGTGVMVPLRIGGTLRKPRATVDAAGAAGEAARLAEGAAASGKGGPLLGIVIGALGADRMIAGAGRDNCAEQLALARGGRAGPLPAARHPRPRAIRGEAEAAEARRPLCQFLR